MRAFVAAAVLALMLGGAPVAAFADDGDTDTATQADDPGIAHLHDAITDMRDANAALRAECPDRSDATCRARLKADAKKVREAFVAARRQAIEEHHAFKEDLKKAREAAKQKLKDDARAQAKDKLKEKKADASESPRPRPSGSPRGDRPAPSASPRP